MKGFVSNVIEDNANTASDVQRIKIIREYNAFSRKTITSVHCTAIVLEKKNDLYVPFVSKPYVRYDTRSAWRAIERELIIDTIDLMPVIFPRVFSIQCHVTDTQPRVSYQIGYIQ